MNPTISYELNKRKTYQHCVFYDMGHGGLRPKDNAYTTAPSKMYDHVKGEFHNGKSFYEGVKNRQYGYEIVRLLREKGINVVEVNHQWQDTDLLNRTTIANEYNKLVQKGIYISEHSNATPNHNAQGLSIWTSEGQSRSDLLANKFYEMFQGTAEAKAGRIKLMKDIKDGDYDYEANFYVLRHTDMPAILIENMFFDNYADATLLLNEDYFKYYTELQAEWIEWCIDYMDDNA